MSSVKISKSQKAEQVEKPNEAVRLQILTPTIALVYEEDIVAAAVLELAAQWTAGWNIFEVARFGLTVAEEYHLNRT